MGDGGRGGKSSPRLALLSRGKSMEGTGGRVSVGLLRAASSKPADDERGLSVLDEPGILERMDPLRDALADSLVSDLLNEGYESRLGPLSLGVSPFSPLDG